MKLNELLSNGAESPTFSRLNYLGNNAAVFCHNASFGVSELMLLSLKTEIVSMSF